MSLVNSTRTSINCKNAIAHCRKRDLNRQTAGVRKWLVPFFMSRGEANPLQLAFKINQRYILRVTAFNYKSFCFSCWFSLFLFISFSSSCFSCGPCVKAVQLPTPLSTPLHRCLWLHNVRIALWFICKSGFSSRSARSACCGLLVISQLALATKSFLIIPKSVDARETDSLNLRTA